MRHGLTAIQTADLVARRKPYDEIKWTADEETVILSKFAEAIREKTLAYFSVCLDANHYRKMSREDRKLFGQKEAMDFAFQRLLGLIIKLKKKWGTKSTVSMAFDYTEDFSQICLKSLARLRMQSAEVKETFTAITFANSNEFPPLQAADMLAYGTKRLLRDAAPGYLEVLTRSTEVDRGPYLMEERYNAEHLEDLRRKFQSGEILPL
jgi:hypothetical protein